MIEQEQTEVTETDYSPAFPDRVSNLCFLCSILFHWSSLMLEQERDEERRWSGTAKNSKNAQTLLYVLFEFSVVMPGSFSRWFVGITPSARA